MIRQDDAACDVRMQAGLGKAIDHGRMLDPGLARNIVFALPVELDEIALDQRELAGLDLDQEDVAARRQDDEVDLAVPTLTVMRGLPGDAVEDLVSVGQRLLQAFEDIELAIQAAVVAKGVDRWEELRHRDNRMSWGRTDRIVAQGVSGPRRSRPRLLPAQQACNAQYL